MAPNCDVATRAQVVTLKALGLSKDQIISYIDIRTQYFFRGHHAAGRLDFQCLADDPCFGIEVSRWMGNWLRWTMASQVLLDDFVMLGSTGRRIRKPVYKCRRGMLQAWNWCYRWRKKRDQAAAAPASASAATANIGQLSQYRCPIAPFLLWRMGHVDKFQRTQQYILPLPIEAWTQGWEKGNSVLIKTESEEWWCSKMQWSHNSEFDDQVWRYDEECDNALACFGLVN
jgi:hypothetical protein